LSWFLGPPKVKNGFYELPHLPESWVRIDPGTADSAFRFRDDGSTISANSVCGQYQDLTLEELSKTLMFGLAEPKFEEMEKIAVDGLPGLRRTISGKMSETAVTVSFSILRSPQCVYDLLLVARSEAFSAHLPTYTNLVAGFREMREP
jgi:hypothetical protein